MIKFYVINLNLLLILTYFSSFQSELKNKDSFFEAIPYHKSNIDFENILEDTSGYNFFTLKNIFGGAGICVGDINNDGLNDIFFSANNGNCKLYLNKGNFKFLDITPASGIEISKGWITGVVMADVNGDGYIDIYVSRTDTIISENSKNLYFENQGNNTFLEKSKELAINDAGLTTQSTFFDMDNDGDLDLYVLNTPIFDDDPNDFTFINVREKDYATSDKLYKNINGKFIDVTLESGLAIEKGSGLGVVISDINMDGWLDIYVANDWIENDKLFINQKDGTFKESLKDFASVTSYFSMGADIADINNDGWPDVFVADMSPDNHYRRNTLINQASIDFYFLQEKNKLINQVSRNTLQINDKGRKFNEAGEIKGIARTDWTWSALFFDMDNDGFKDLFIGNGNKREIGNMDIERLMFEKFDEITYKYDIEELANLMPLLKTKNYFYKNENGINFSDKTNLWDKSDTVNTQGAAYADLNNDGAIDLILNNTDDYASILKNTNKQNFIRIKAIGDKKNTQGLGTKAWVFYDNKMQYSELSNARGFQSSSENILHFGLGNKTNIDSIYVLFLSGKFEVFKKPIINQTLEISERKASFSNFNFDNFYFKKEAVVNFSDELLDIPFIHKEEYFSDFKEHKLLHRKYSKLGPALTIGDVNNDGLDDFFIGGGLNKKSFVYIQNIEGKFNKYDINAISVDSIYEDVCASFIDINSDGHLDLIVSSGSYEHLNSPLLFSVRVYLGNGSCEFIKCNDCIPKKLGLIATILPLDFDNDGHIDLFLGGRVSTKQYGEIPNSFLLKNNGKGKFIDVSNSAGSNLSNIGMVTCALYEDIDNDNNKELIVAGEWMPICIFKLANKEFINVTSQFGLEKSHGWWNSLLISDVNANGKKDIIAGNFGLNSIFKASTNEPVKLLINDFDGNGHLNSVLTLFLKGEEGSYHGRNLICSDMPSYHNKFFKYETYAKSSIEELFSKDLYDSAKKLKITELRSGIFFQNKNNSFTFNPFPAELQLAPINTIIETKKGQYYVAGNFNQSIYELGKITSLNPTFFSVKPNKEVNFISKVDYNSYFTNHSIVIDIDNCSYILNGNNNDKTTLFKAK